jgi:hypothetical protein
MVLFFLGQRQRQPCLSAQCECEFGCLLVLRKRVRFGGWDAVADFLLAFFGVFGGDGVL